MRLRSLDSLRGVAASFVVLHHWMFIYWGNHLPYRHPHGLREFAADAWFHFSTLGPAAVQVFFALSGFVLTLALIRNEDSYAVFILKRVIRIYPPYLAAVLFCLVLISLVPRGQIPALSPWFNGFWVTLPSFGIVAGHMGMLGSPKFESLNNVAWSLIHEIRISLIFPFITLLVRRSLWTVAGAMFVSILARLLADHTEALAANLLLTLYYAATFFMGSAIALHLAGLQGWYDRLQKFQKAALYCGVFALLNIPVQIGDGRLTVSTIGLGGTCLVALCAIEPRIRRILERRFFLYLGRISYSLYLFHFPVMLAVIHVLHDRLPAYVIVIVGSVLVWMTSDLANRLIEKPCQRVSHYLGKRYALAPAS